MGVGRAYHPGRGVCWSHGGGEARVATSSPMKSLLPGALGRVAGASWVRPMQRPQAGCILWHMSQSGVPKRRQRLQVAIVKERQRSHGMSWRGAWFRSARVVLCPMLGRSSTHFPPLETPMRRAEDRWWQWERGRPCKATPGSNIPQSSVAQSRAAVPWCVRVVVQGRPRGSSPRSMQHTCCVQELSQPARPRIWEPGLPVCQS